MTTGKCLCGAVRFELQEPAKETGLCHCKMCRRWGGGLAAAGLHCGGATISGEENLRWWKSSEWGERGFCGVCGSSLFWRAPGGGENGGDHFVAMAGVLDDDAAVAGIHEHIYIDEKPAFYDIAGDAPRSTGAQFVARVFAQLTQQYGEEFLQDAMQKCRAHNGNAFANEVQTLLAKKDGNP